MKKQETSNDAPREERIGWSEAAGSSEIQAFIRAKYRPDWRMLLILGVVLLMAIAMTVTGESESNPLSSFFPSAGSGGNVDVLISLIIFAAIIVTFFVRSARVKHTYVEGRVTSKSVSSKPAPREVPGLAGFLARRKLIPLYVIMVQDGSGKSLRMETVNKKTYELYETGQRVRFHEPFEFIEKYDKTGDTVSCCPHCKTENVPTRRTCRACGCPLLH